LDLQSFVGGRTSLQRLALAASVLTLLLAGCGATADMPDTVPLRVAAATSGLLHAGVGVADITPEPGGDLAGFNIFRDSTGVHDPLTARALVLERGGFALALISLDLIGLQAEDAERLRPTHPRIPPERIYLHTTHTHHGPDTLGFWGLPPLWSGMDADYMDALGLAMQRALDGAARDLRPAELATASRHIEPARVAKNLREAGLVDPDVGVLHVREPEGGPTVATLVTFGCHPEAVHKHNTLLSADYPGALRDRLEAALGGTALFFAGSLGAMVTPDTVGGYANRWNERERIGRELADHALAITRTMGPYDRTPALQTAGTDVYFEPGNWRYDLARWTGMLERTLFDGHIRTEVNLIRIADASLLTVPGEIPPDVGMSLEAMLPGSPRLLLGLTEDELGYLLPPEAFEDDRFSYEQTFSPGPAAVPAIREAVRRLVDALPPAP
jgi:hypothetical protein